MNCFGSWKYENMAIFIFIFRHSGNDLILEGMAFPHGILDIKIKVSIAASVEIMEDLQPLIGIQLDASGSDLAEMGG